ncbi:hypothetical protein EHQ23_02805 [Leptospira bourretii]|uniref:Uncharacterized protein n=1 Tax=Leptospira bourretii TaxID=2484962 RepID=A0A4R9IPU3_9LEPT|nr:hypothetical protein EHQ23_02805 [Leptospira bourretii]TGK93496.1 hypothetical protein EHQ26_05540 [Leptospira bourretii]TGL36207.1 hypothetical protein EHQ45_07345 [Leptospira bourretii]
MSRALGLGPHPEWVVEAGLWEFIHGPTPTINSNSCLLGIQSHQKILRKLRSFTKPYSLQTNHEKNL